MVILAKRNVSGRIGSRGHLVKVKEKMEEVGKRNLESEHTFSVFSEKSLETRVDNWKGVWQSGKTTGTLRYKTEG